MGEQKERVKEKSESKTRRWWEKEQSQHEGTQNRERKGQIMGCRPLVSAVEAGKHWPSNYPIWSPWLPNGIRKDSRKEERLCSYLQLSCCHLTTYKHNMGIRSLNWLLCIFKSSSCISFPWLWLWLLFPPLLFLGFINSLLDRQMGSFILQTQ